MTCCHENETSHLHEHQYGLNVTLTLITGIFSLVYQLITIMLREI